MTPINVDRIADWIAKGRINPAKPITIVSLNASRCLTNDGNNMGGGIKLLARGASALTCPINITVSRASAAAIAAVEAAGGTVTTRYYTHDSMGRILKGQSHPTYSLQSKLPDGLDYKTETAKYKYRLSDPASRKDIEYYRDPAHRGYLSHLLQEGQGPSLFFKVPGQGLPKKGKVVTAAGKTKTVVKGENRVW